MLKETCKIIGPLRKFERERVLMCLWIAFFLFAIVILLFEFQML